MKRISYYFKKKRLLHSILHLGLGVLIAISLFPLSIHAQALTSPFLGINFQVTAYGENMSSIVLPKINFDYISGTTPSATISGQLNCTSPSTPTSSNPCDVFSFQNTSGQGGSSNGTRIFLNLQQYLLDANGNATINHQSYFFIDYEFILDDNYKGYVTITDADSNSRTIYVNGNQFHYQRMQLDTSEKAITIDDYELIRVTDVVMWDIPFESLSWNYYMFNNGFTYNTINPFNINYLTYPLFNVNQNDVLFQFYSSSTNLSEYQVIMLTNRNIYNMSTLNTYFAVDNGEFTDFIRINSFRSSGYVYNLIKFKITNFTASSSTILNFKFIGTTSVNIVMPIMFVPKSYYKYISDDFAERYGLLGYQESSEDLIDTNTQFQTDANSLISIEDSFNSTMNSNLDNINPTFDMGSSFLASANWVSTQFNRIVNNTPFASLITFGLTLGLGLLIIGKIRK